MELLLLNLLIQILNKHAMDNFSSQNLIEKLDNWTYRFLKENFGIVTPPSDPKPVFVKKPNTVSFSKEHLRKVIRALERAGLKNSEKLKQMQGKRRIFIRKHEKSF